MITFPYYSPSKTIKLFLNSKSDSKKFKTAYEFTYFSGIFQTDSQSIWKQKCKHPMCWIHLFRIRFYPCFIIKKSTFHQNLYSWRRLHVFVGTVSEPPSVLKFLLSDRLGFWLVAVVVIGNPGSPAPNVLHLTLWRTWLIVRIQTLALPSSKACYTRAFSQHAFDASG